MNSDPVPAKMADFPLAHAARPQAIRRLSDELRAFNAGMEPFQPAPLLALPVVALHGACDRTATPDWHLPWLARRCARLGVDRVAGAGHMILHAAPQRAVAAVRRVAGQPMDAGAAAE